MFKKPHSVIIDPKYSSHLVRKTETVVKYLKTPFSQVDFVEGFVGIKSRKMMRCAKRTIN